MMVTKRRSRPKQHRNLLAQRLRSPTPKLGRVSAETSTAVPRSDPSCHQPRRVWGPKSATTPATPATPPAPRIPAQKASAPPRPSPRLAATRRCLRRRRPPNRSGPPDLQPSSEPATGPPDLQSPRAPATGLLVRLQPLADALAPGAPRMLSEVWWPAHAPQLAAATRGPRPGTQVLHSGRTSRSRAACAPPSSPPARAGARRRTRRR
mmetsp:Transcript_45109/g.114396  ORF Transcript_45109/g.114396 Transcript_45109/m.114396 type:complete len:208 (-) Transcript_45109:379-1002(-)